MKWHILLLFGVFLVAVGMVVRSEHREIDNGHPLILGIFPRFHPAIVNDSFTPLAKYLSRELGRRVRLEVSTDFEDFWQKLRSNRFDIVHYNQYHYIRSHKERGYQVIAMNEEQGRHTMTAAIVVRKDSPVKTIRDLQGKRILFGGSQQAMISYIYATYLLREAGLRKGDYEERFEVNPPTAVVATYHGLWDAAAAGTGDIALKQPVIKKQIDTSGMRYLAVGKQFSNIPWAVKGGMDNTLKRQIKRALLQLKTVKDGRRILKKAKISGIVSAKDSDFDPHRRITRMVLNENY